MKTELFAAAILALACGLLNGASPSETAQNTIEKSLHSKNPDTRKDAARALAIVGSKPYQERLESMLNDKDMQVRLTAVAKLAEWKDATALRVALDDRTPEVRFAAAKALFAMNDPSAQATLLRILKGDARTASNLFTQREREALRTLQTPKPMMLMAVRFGGSYVPLPGAGFGISTALDVVSNRGGSDRAAVALLLSRKNDPETIAALQQALADKNAPIRAAAVEAIALGDNVAMLADVESMLNDKSPIVRLCAAAGYLRLRSAASHTVVHSWD